MPPSSGERRQCQADQDDARRLRNRHLLCNRCHRAGEHPVHGATVEGVVERWEGRVSEQASKTGPRVACISSWGAAANQDASCCRPPADTRSSDLPGGLRRLLRGVAPVIPGRRAVQIPALREFRSPHIREFGNKFGAMRWARTHTAATPRPRTLPIRR
jgi:hypothetical protein